MKVMIHASQRTIHRFKRIQALLDQLHPDNPPQALIVPGSPEPCDNIIVFPGSFNPPTKAHIALLKQARQYTRQHAPTHLYVAISKHIVDKEKVERALLLDRIMLLETVLHHHLRQTGIMLFNRGLYVEQAEAVQRSFPKVKKLFFLIGYDKIVQILDPRYYDDRDTALKELFSLAEVLVVPRAGFGPKELEELLHKPENEPFTRYIHPLPFSTTYRNMSSSRIREHPDEYMHDLPPEVRRFMLYTRAYAPPLHLTNGTEMDYYGERMKVLESLLHSSSDLKHGPV